MHSEGLCVSSLHTHHPCAAACAPPPLLRPPLQDLAAAKPALEEALSALNSITAKDINNLKALKNPPDIVKRIFDCVLLLKHNAVNAVRAWGLG